MQASARRKVLRDTGSRSHYIINTRNLIRTSEQTELDEDVLKAGESVCVRMRVNVSQ